MDRKCLSRWVVLILGVLALNLSALAHAATVGEPVPDFTATGSNGQTYNLSAYKGHWVVLEWHNQDCPFVKSQYKGKMERLQAKWTKKHVIWFTVISSPPGAPGNVDAAQANEDMKEHHAHPTAVLLDPSGTIGHAFGAKTTPHMFVINPQGILVYDGAIDNAPLEDKKVKENSDGQPYINYVDKALTEGMAGKKIAIPTTPPYGCHVPYAD